MACWHTPCPSRTCFMGKGRTSQETFSWLVDCLGKASTTGSWANSLRTMSGDPAATVPAVMNSRRENPGRAAMGIFLLVCSLSDGYCIHYSQGDESRNPAGARTRAYTARVSGFREFMAQRSGFACVLICGLGA